MTHNMIDTIMIFAAGRGSRMESLTKNTPKTLLKICDKPILYYILELVATYPFKKIVINTHYLHEQVDKAIAEFRAMHPLSAEIILIYQDEMLENGGAVKNAEKYFDDKSIFTLNGDVIIKAKQNIFEALQSNWQPEDMDFLLLLQDMEQAVGYKGHGDFEIDTNGKLSRPKQDHNYSFMYTGLNILKPTLIKTNEQRKFSLKDYYVDPLIRLYGKVLDESKWYHANQPRDLKDIELALC